MIGWTRSLLGALPADVRRAAIASLRAAPFAFALGVVVALALPTMYRSDTAFIAESQDVRSLASAGLGALAGQFGITAGLGGAQTPLYFADLLETRSILLPILDMPTTTTDDTVPRPLIDRLRITGRDRRDREERGVRRLRSSLQITPDAKTSVVSLSVNARDPLLAYQVAQALLSSLDRFNVSVRRSRARNEREFLEGRVSAVQDDLRSAETDLERFLTANRGDTRSFPSLAFREAGLRRKLDMTQTRFVELQRQLDQARVQEVRDTPAITVIDKPNVPVRRYRPRRKLVTLELLVVGMLGAYAFSRLTSLIKANQQPAVG
jgi:uncharacterized protein involved in exopolysaccharide biosynthesis